MISYEGCGDAPQHADQETAAIQSLKTALKVDGSGVALLTGIAMVAMTRRHPSRTDQGIALTAAVGLAGFGLALAAVRLAAGNHAGSAARGLDVRPAQHLVVAGFAINTIGSMMVIARFRRHAAPVAAAGVLLVTGDILSKIYLHHLSALNLRG